MRSESGLKSDRRSTTWRMLRIVRNRMNRRPERTRTDTVDHGLSDQLLSWARAFAKGMLDDFLVSGLLQNFLEFFFFHDGSGGGDEER